MLIQQILLKILYTFQQERTVSAAFHLLKGKRSGQTIHDVGLYNLYPFFGLLPKLTRQKFDEQIDLLFAKNAILIEENGYYSITEYGKQLAAQSLPISFDSWHYRGNEHLFFSRVSLIVQSLSHQLHQKNTFIPIERNEQIQQWVRQFLLRHQYQKQLLQQALHSEISVSLSMLTIEEKIKDLIIYRLSGYNEPGFTWQQLAFGYEMHEMDVQLLYISGLHAWLNELSHKSAQYPLLHDIMQNIRVEVLLTSSANATAKLYKVGRTIEEISQIRRLKINTIEDHIVEMAMNETNFSIEPFITIEEQQQVLAAVEDYGTKRLKTLKEILPHLSYFQLRLTLAKGAITT
ncbi:helix-turn-helix domain-containing protein [Solibacillus merdavium]|uniref:Helix-turn-helix domain-containing protein n=1 Tax=Solibacillus merdavium TaxID=2762218 RepID=A0ABR8XJ71_9BACL|nr:helix-turn-helix domain-containing protein [Solibacillus merdavium]MBD8031988.1 helix-turn-helix domain-containing protein [Solibacillus merdavium]